MDTPTAGGATRHPAGLYVLFFVELWERFGFYCLSALLVLYMQDPENGRPWLQENSSDVWGWYLGGVYFAPFLGGLLAEWRLGYRWAIALGAVVMGAGYALLAVNDLSAFFGGLALVVVGNGLFKPNISTLVGKLYPPGDPRVDSGFTIFYMGINVGAFVAPFAAGAVRAKYGYHAAFAIAAGGMLASLVTFVALRYLLVEYERPAGAAATDADPAVQSRRNLALALFFGINVLFWMAFKQNGNTLSLWAKSHTDRHAPGWLDSLLTAVRLDGLFLDAGRNVLPEYFASINPFFVIALSPVLAGLFARLRAVGREPPTPSKLVAGFALTAAAFAVMGTAATTTAGLASPWWLVGTYAVLTTGELCLSPMGLSLVSKLAAPPTRAVWMGGFFVSTAVGGYLSGAVRSLTKSWSFGSFFTLLFGTSLFAMTLMILAYPVVAAAMPRAKPPTEEELEP